MNSFGTLFRLTTFGESHGTAIGGIIDGCPSGLLVDMDFVDSELRRRREGDRNRSTDVSVRTETTARQETDQVEWLSGLFEGRTLGTPIAFLVRNEDCRPEDYKALRGLCRPGHADYTYEVKYGLRDHRGGGRASGRETVARVVAGAIAKQILNQLDIEISSIIDGMSVCCTIEGLPAGVGEPVFDRLNARLAYAMMSIPSAIAFSMGTGTAEGEYRPDAWTPHGIGPTLTVTNHCGGVQGGISNGMPVVFRVGFHPPVSNPVGMVCRDAEGNLHTVAPGGRHDSNHISRLPVIVEAMAALVAVDLGEARSKN